LKVLLLGSEGFVGQNLIDGLKEKHELLTADVLNSGTHTNYTKFDITNIDETYNLIKNIDVVINLVTHTLTQSLNDVISNANTNIIGLLNVLEACRKNKIKKTIFTSASSIIGIPNTFSVDEKHSVMPQTAYGITKMAAEHYHRLYKELYGLNYVIFRFFNIYGPYQTNGIIPSFHKKLINNESITVFGEGKQIRDFVFIRDVVPFFDNVITSSKFDNQTYNLGTGNGTTIMEVIEKFSKLLSVKPKIDFQPERPGEIGNFVANTDFLLSEFGFKPETSIEDGLKDTIS
jgi:UDP-glucose 4-epimerase